MYQILYKSENLGQQIYPLDNFIPNIILVRVQPMKIRESKREIRDWQIKIANILI